MAKFISDLTFGERIRYSSAYLEAWDSVNKCVRYIALKAADQSITLAEKMALDQQHIRKLAVRTLLEAARQSFRAGTSAISPPNESKVEELRQLADEIDVLTRNSDAAQQVVEIADTALTLFNRIQSIT